MPIRRQKVPSFIFCVGEASSNSLASMVSLHTLDTDDSRPSSMRGAAPSFGKVGIDQTLTSKAPRLPQRKLSMSFRRVPSSFEMNHKGSMLNARFEMSLFQTTEKNDDTPSPFDRFGCLATIPSPSCSSRKTAPRKILNTTDSPLSLPRRKPSEQSCSLSPSTRDLLGPPKQYNPLLSGAQNAKFDRCQQRRSLAVHEVRRISNMVL